MCNTQPPREREAKVWTIPNALSTLRLCMIPLFVWLYYGRHSMRATALVLLLSGATDVVDGWIARRFQMTSDVGRILDPIADKLTQGAMLICLLTRFPAMLLPLLLLLVKELSVGVTGFLVIRKTGKISDSRWYGKLATCLLYTMMIIHVLWPTLPTGLSYVMIGLCSMSIAAAFVFYLDNNLGQLAEAETNAMGEAK